MDNRNQVQMLLQIQQLSFVATDLNLYLDTHPYDQQALAMFNQVHNDLMQAVNNYEQIYGPMLNFGYSPNVQKCWEWISSPWPWEIKY